MIRTALVIGILVGLMGCGESIESRTDAVTMPDAATPGSCGLDSDGYVTFSESVTVASDAETCQATYTISRGVNRFDCTCAAPSSCSQASLLLVAKGQACFVPKT